MPCSFLVVKTRKKNLYKNIYTYDTSVILTMTLKWGNSHRLRRCFHYIFLPVAAAFGSLLSPTLCCCCTVNIVCIVTVNRSFHCYFFCFLFFHRPLAVQLSIKLGLISVHKTNLPPLLVQVRTRHNNSSGGENTARNIDIV